MTPPGAARWWWPRWLSLVAVACAWQEEGTMWSLCCAAAPQGEGQAAARRP